VAIEVVIHPFEKIASNLLDAIRAAIKERFGLRAAIGEKLAVPAQAYSRERRQYLSTSFLDLLLERARGKNQILLGVTSVDLYAPDLNFVFGEASSDGRVAVFSLARLYSMTGAETEDIPLGIGPSQIESLSPMIGQNSVRATIPFLGLTPTGRPSSPCGSPNRVRVGLLLFSGSSFLHPLFLSLFMPCFCIVV
jgi:hypothetical protein